jgi:hypothetical protein
MVLRRMGTGTVISATPGRSHTCSTQHLFAHLL